MAITVEEKANSRGYSETKDTKRFERIFIVTGTDDPYVARAYGPALDDTYGAGLILHEKNTQIIRIRDGSTDGVCQLTCVYVTPDENTQEENEPLFEYIWDTSSQSAHIIKAISQTHYPATADVGLLIGVDEDRIEGVDIPVPKGVYTETRQVENTSLTYGYRNLLHDFSGKINSVNWKGWQAEEVLFLGAVARRLGTGKWSFQYSFQIELNETLTISTVHGNQVVNKKGWDYIWYQRVKDVDAAQKRLTYDIESVHLAKVKETRNFQLLGIGT